MGAGAGKKRDPFEIGSPSPYQIWALHPQRTTPVPELDDGPGNLDLVIVQGDIAKEKVDVIVNTTNKDFDLQRGDVSSSILGAAGPSMQSEALKARRTSGSSFVVTGGHSLSCKLVYHVALDDWNNSALKHLEDVVYECLKQANSHGCTSISFPLLGTGGLGYPLEDAARSMFSAIDRFWKNQGRNSMKIRIVISFQDRVDTVRRLCKEVFPDLLPSGGHEGFESGDRGLVERPFTLTPLQEPDKTFRQIKSRYRKGIGPQIISISERRHRLYPETPSRESGDRGLDERPFTLTPLQGPDKTFRQTKSKYGNGIESGDRGLVKRPFTLTPLQESDETFRQIKSQCENGIQMISVARVDNATLRQQYEAKKAQLDQQNPDLRNELMLWHGTSFDATEYINHYGFNRSLCGKNGTNFGEGVYFAVNCRYAMQETFSPPKRDGRRYMYWCKVLVGHSTTGSCDMKVLPARDGHILYDSATDNPSHPEMYIIFNDTQAYPEYLITFKGS